MVERIAEESPRLKARIAGALWLTAIVTGLSAFIIRSPLLVPGDAAATAANILASESLYRLTFVFDLVAGICYLAVTVIMYGLMKPVSRSVSLLAAIFGLSGVIIGSVTSLNDLAALAILRSEQYSSVFTTSQLQAMAQTSLRVSGLGFNLAMVFFGLQVFSIGTLIIRCTFLPRILGVLLVLGGLSYITSSFANFLAPDFGSRLTLFIVQIALLGEGSLTLWLLLKGVNIEQWKAQAINAEGVRC